MSLSSTSSTSCNTPTTRHKRYTLWVANCGTSSLLAMISSQSPHPLSSTHPRPLCRLALILLSVISANGATKLLDAGRGKPVRPTLLSIHTHTLSHTYIQIKRSSHCDGLAIKTTRVTSQWRNFVLNFLAFSFNLFLFLSLTQYASKIHPSQFDVISKLQKDTEFVSWSSLSHRNVFHSSQHQPSPPTLQLSAYPLTSNALLHRNIFTHIPWRYFIFYHTRAYTPITYGS